MATPELLDIESLLQPISDETPAGQDGRRDRSPTSLFYQIKDCRERARTAERNIMIDDENRNIANREWQNIVKLAPQMLQKQSKDLEVCAWLLEGMVRTHGFAGLKDSLQLTLGLVEQYWEQIFPIPDEEDDEDINETRCAPFAGLNGEGRDGTLIQPLRSIPITEEHDFGPYAYWQYQQALEIQKIHDEDARNERIATAGISMERFDRAISSSSRSFYENLVADIEIAIDAFGKLSAALDSRAGSHAPPSSNIRNCLREILGAVRHKAADKLDQPQAEADPLEPASAAETGSATAAPVSNTQNTIEAVIRSREDAFRQLQKLADYFRKTEPHSPISYQLEKTVRWGKMPLHELMMELLQDRQSRETYEMLTGVTLESK
jgi:type VI secretion system protein ImpA